jgi:hypothetical protein
LESFPLQQQPKAQRDFQRECLSFILRDQEAGIPGICGHFESRQGVGGLSGAPEKIDAEKTVKLYKKLL